MLLKANKYRKDKKADCRQNELGSRIFVGRVFVDYAECLHFYPSFSYGRIIAGERYSLCHNHISRGAGLDGVSACRTLWFASIYDLLMVSQEYGSHYSVVGKNLHGFWHHAFSAIRRRRFTGYSD